MQAEGAAPEINAHPSVQKSPFEPLLCGQTNLHTHLMVLSLFIPLLAKAHVNFYSMKTEISYDGLTPFPPCHLAHFVNYDLFIPHKLGTIWTITFCHLFHKYPFGSYHVFSSRWVPAQGFDDRSKAATLDLGGARECCTQGAEPQQTPVLAEAGGGPGSEKCVPVSLCGLGDLPNVVRNNCHTLLSSATSKTPLYTFLKKQQCV